MKNSNTRELQTAWSALRSICVAMLGMALTVAAPIAAHADTIPPPFVPDRLVVDAPNEVFFVGQGVGTQNYVCLPTATGVDWSLFTPEATLFNDELQQVTTHFFSVNPPEQGSVILPTWESSKDSSIVWAQAINVATSKTDPTFVRQDAIAWVTLQQAGVQAGPTGGKRLTKTTFIQRVNTVGGVAPADACKQVTDIGKRAFVPYTADYFFYFDPTAQQ